MNKDVIKTIIKEGQNKLNTTSRYFLTLLACTATLWATAQTHIRPQHDYSHRASLYDVEILTPFEDESHGFVAGENVTEANVAANCPFQSTPCEGRHFLYVKTAEAVGDAWRIVSRTFSQKLDLSQRPFVQLRIQVQASSVRDIFVRLSLFCGSRRYDCIAPLVPNHWRTPIFDCSECPFVSQIERMEVGVSTPSPKNNKFDFILDQMETGRPIDFDFTRPISTACFQTNSGRITWADDQLIYRYKKPGALTVSLGSSLHNLYTPPVETRNTIRVVADNRSKADSLRVSFTTTTDNRFEHHSKTFALDKKKGKRNYLFNISDLADLSGYYTGLRFEPIGGRGGELRIDRITFEREEPIVELAGRITSCRANEQRIHIKGTIRKEYIGQFDELAVYDLPIDYTRLEDGRKIYSTTHFGETFEINDLSIHPDNRPQMTRLSSRFVLVLSGKGRTMWVDKGRYIDNWEDFTQNPYAFDVKGKTYNVLDYGAKGDGFTNDTHAIQRAITAATKAGGGTILLPGSNDEYGRRYVATSIELTDNMELRLDSGAVIWQSGDVRDYNYMPVYGHEMEIPGVMWAHAHFINMPLIYIHGRKRVKVTGPGTIRMHDPFTQSPEIKDHNKNCQDRIHITPLAISNSNGIELKDFEVVRTNIYNTVFECDSNMYIGNVRLHDAACLSADGFSLPDGTRNVIIDRCVHVGNDDGVTLTATYKNPQALCSPWRSYTDGHPHGPHNIRVVHSYINSAYGGGGKAIAFIPWGSTDPEQQNQITDSIFVTDCVLVGGYSVGTWPDNPFDGKPFTNAETDDFSAIQDVWILNNDYRNGCSLQCVTPTNFITDCGIASSGTILNGDFKDGRCYWSRRGNVRITTNGATVEEGQSLFQGLTLKAGRHSVTFRVKGTGKVVVREAMSGKLICANAFDASRTTEITTHFDIPSNSTYEVGIEGGRVDIYSAASHFQKRVD